MKYSGDISEQEILASHLTAVEVENVTKPLEQASVMPLKVYSNRAYHEREVEKVLRPSWHALARVHEVAEPGAFVTSAIFGEPVLIIRGKDGVLRALSNVCRHRGTQLMTDCGVAKALVCPYHSWTYNIDGGLRGAPQMNKIEGFDPKTVRLPEFKLEVWNGFVFVNLDPQAEPLAGQISALTEKLAVYKLDDWVSVPWKEFEFDWNWKISLENFSEAYHHIGVHKNSIGKVSLAENALYEDTNNNYSLFFVHIGGHDDEYLPEAGHPFPNIPNLPPFFHEYSPVVNIYPTFHMVMGPNFMLWLRIEVEAVDRHRLIWRWMVAPESAQLPDFEERLKELDAMMAPIVAEDVGFMPRVKAVVRSQVFEPGRYCDQERALHQMHQWLLAKMGAAADALLPKTQTA
ncbi:ring-hydroxylating dioxygenase, large terminal subunit [Caulobacter sp. AP07]|uniref:aromatic ring-hydroxylating oxygenase subunit alpha n=1 Tax=Caulobacter sp. AP07 TaxID=1144304 RepID=UPI0002720C69|nr:aromatic ring-hydroxylating dioxygenase subunit alpha [Caulobacter sp. AP07]EJL27350.1 ring-hydroxylating dioxygenase, large terminal subunit [Caulobacter sp. AP07]